MHSTAAIEQYPKLVVSGTMREFVGQRVVNEPELMKLAVVNKKYERTEGVSREALEDDSYGLEVALFESMGTANGNLPDQLIAKCLESPGTWMDNANFFGSRKIGKATINNKTTNALTADNYETACLRMMQFRDADNESPLGLIPDTLMVSPALAATARKIINSQFISSGESNPVTIDNPHKDSEIGRAHV